MITIEEARELVNNAVIPFPAEWKQLMLTDIESTIRNCAIKGKRFVSMNGKISANVAGGWAEFQLNAEQLAEVAAVLETNGFHVEKDFRIRYDGRPLSIDIFW